MASQQTPEEYQDEIDKLSCKLEQVFCGILVLCLCYFMLIAHLGFVEWQLPADTTTACLCDENTSRATLAPSVPAVSFWTAPAIIESIVRDVVKALRYVPSTTFLQLS